MSEHQVVAAIDFGTHGTGFAWATVDGLNDDDYSRQIFFYDKFLGTELVYPKNLSAVLTDATGEVLEWGFEAERRWAELVARKETAGHGYAYAFKMALNRDGSGTDMPTAHGDLDLADRTVLKRLVAGVLRRVRDLAVKEITDAGYLERAIRWCVTIPAIWSDADKQFMREAAADAGLPDDSDRLLLAIEPEAAALYSAVRMTRVLSESEGRDTEQRLNLQMDGARFMVVDCGGGTVDITAYRTTAPGGKNTRLVEIGRAAGGKLGSEYINHAFRTQLLAQRFGADLLARLERDHAGHIAKLMSAWEAAKVRLRCETGPDGSSTITSTSRITIPGALWEALDEATRTRLTTEADYETYTIIVSPAEAQALMDHVVEPILRKIDDQLDEMRRATGARGDEVLLIVGGFARCDYLCQRIRQRFGADCRVLVPADPAIAVLAGAVHFCYRPEVIVARRSKLTYGFQIAKPFEHGVDPVARMFRDDDGDVMCGGRFEIAVRAGQTVEVDEPFPFPVVPSFQAAEKITVTYYATRKLDPRFVDEEGCQEIGSMTVDMSGTVGKGGDERAVVIVMYFGRTQIQATATVLSTNETVETRLDFAPTF